ncbi:MAG TPA: DUF721 domain-containing protein [bacterium]|mgnify:CR=1 FL=1|nr:DUF721 domain-containing protein [bacterium]
MDKFSKVLNKAMAKPFSRIVMNWSKIAGQSNRDIMMPLELRKGVLYIAVPNGMVAKAASRFKKKIIENITGIIGVSSLNDIKFKIEPALFKNKTKTPPVKTKKKTVKICDKKTAEKKEQLLKLGISSDLAEIFAQIEQLWEDEP